MWRELTLKITLELAVSYAEHLLKVETHSDVTKIRSTESNETFTQTIVFSYAFSDLDSQIDLMLARGLDRNRVCFVCGRQSH